MKDEDWLDIKTHPIDLNRIHFLLDGDSIFIQGTALQPFLLQLCGGLKPIGKINFSHWMPFPKPPTFIKNDPI